MPDANPFSAHVPPGFPGDRSPEECHAVDVIHAAAEAFWSFLDGLPPSAELTLAKRRLQETVFWAIQGTRR